MAGQGLGIAPEELIDPAGPETTGKADLISGAELAGKLGAEVGQTASITMDARNGNMRGINDGKDSIRIIGTGVDDAKRSQKDLNSAGLGHINVKNPYQNEGSYATNTHSMGNRLTGWMQSEANEHRDWRQGVENRKERARGAAAGMKAFQDSYGAHQRSMQRDQYNQNLQNFNRNMQNFNQNFGYHY